MSHKQRLSASVDADLLEAAQEAAARVGAGTLSAWINDALRLKLEHDQRSQALAAFVEAYEADHGVIGDEEIRGAVRRASSRAVTTRGTGREGTVRRASGRAVTTRGARREGRGRRQSDA